MCSVSRISVFMKLRKWVVLVVVVLVVPVVVISDVISRYWSVSVFFVLFGRVVMAVIGGGRLSEGNVSGSLACEVENNR